MSPKMRTNTETITDIVERLSTPGTEFTIPIFDDIDINKFIIGTFSVTSTYNFSVYNRGAYRLEFGAYMTFNVSEPKSLGYTSTSKNYSSTSPHNAAGTSTITAMLFPYGDSLFMVTSGVYWGESSCITQNPVIHCYSGQDTYVNDGGFINLTCTSRWLTL